MKPRDRRESHLYERFAEEDEIPYEEEREARKNKRIWKRQTNKHRRQADKHDIKKGYEE